MISVKGVNFSLLIELLSHFHLPQTYLVQQATLFTKEFIIQSYMRLKWPCRSGCTPKAVRFYPSTSATSILFVARIKKMAPKKKSYMSLKWPCRSGCTPKTVHFNPSTSATSILFVARIKKMAPKKKPVASILGIPRENIFANNLLFGNSGEFVGFDEKEPTSRSGGKAKAVQHIRKGRSYKTMVMIGDGATDLEARRPGGADFFICYAGVQLREAVAEQADWLIFNFEPLINSLD
ncbi:hypothetical protein F2Q70_00040191 [Brassica cretica]|uniref:phosphoserine phosphatase n=1 Tax=Brassica cretica TaxID=69181 RepID=A0A8S9K4T6_BRACR|nr:hypothetical protein F2Q70_00040191 [Brassica cretica]